ncbi:Hypothetical predicted protein [Cloeon dipterum]|uniref:Amino acid permease/ SLC12A domain-containing protein n=1 Tax=Cloeon dipterum TaxID=197152 RepID=A0A8S1D3L3_9INSE|nr:Hypothetical predicted protein [Cloeon dipterum]
MLFLRLSWVVAQAGIALSLVTVVISAIICVITTLSLSALCTNGEMKGGGIYYVISRTLGAEYGASIGVVFAFANTVAAAMNTIGFCDALIIVLDEFDIKLIDGGLHDVQIYGTIALLVMICICILGMDWEVKAQNVLVVIITAAVVDFVVGTILGPTDNIEVVQGFEGWSLELFIRNMGPDFRFSEGINQDFFTVFAIFFPSVTGVQAGANISGDLKDPADAIPKGTLLALAISMLSYVVLIIMAGGGALRDASGVIDELSNSTFANCTARACHFGLHNNYTIMELMSSWSPLIYAGCFAATLSTALTNIVSVPRLIRALGEDEIYPGLVFFSKGYWKKDEPIRGYVLTFFVALTFIIIADLNAIAPLISNFYLASYALINFCTFHAAFVKPTGWRPSFRFYNKWLSLIGAISCVMIMFLINPNTTLITVVVIIVLYLVVMYRKPDVNWGSSKQAQTYNVALNSTYQLELTNEHVKNYKPQILLLSGNPAARPALLQLASHLSKSCSLLLCGKISTEKLSHSERSCCTNQAMRFLSESKIRAFFSVVDNVKFALGVRCLLQASGVGKLRPNVMMTGFKNDWRDSSREDLNEYFTVLHEALDMRMGLVILRVAGGLDYSKFTGNDDPISGCSPCPNLKEKPLFRCASGISLPENVMKKVTIFNSSLKKGTIDVWWLYDDGGLTLLLPYILHTRAKWSNCKLRIFGLVERTNKIDEEKQNLEILLSKFRIKSSSITMVRISNPQPSSNELFEEITKPLRIGVGLDAHQIQTEQHLGMRDLLQKHSMGANLIVMTLPIPKKGDVSALLYMVWLEVLTRDMPPFLLVRGNQKSVLSFYA